ncbi:hypothetical protein [Porphyromonas macacae]|uniref:hypothetical protein n=1 Tax=Porphyromonas macacae TaxID=28115 RepID=UPI0035A0215C
MDMILDFSDIFIIVDKLIEVIVSFGFGICRCHFFQLSISLFLYFFHLIHIDCGGKHRQEDTAFSNGSIWILRFRTIIFFTSHEPYTKGK